MILKLCFKDMVQLCKGEKWIEKKEKKKKTFFCIHLLEVTYYH